jgi:hypothetical protein
VRCRLAVAVVAYTLALSLCLRLPLSLCVRRGSKYRCLAVTAAAEDQQRVALAIMDGALQQ